MSSATKDRTMYTPPQVAEMMGVNPSKVRVWIMSGELKAVDLSAKRGFGNPRYRITQDALDSFITRRQVLPTKRVGGHMAR